MNDELTASDLAKMEAEIEERKLVLRPKLIEAVKEASKLTEDQLKGIIGVLKIHYQEVDENEQTKDS